jgi:hypothetical protein
MSTPTTNEYSVSEARMDEESPDGIFQNGDVWLGEMEIEEGQIWFTAYPVKSNDHYQTLEVPMTMKVYIYRAFDFTTNKYFFTVATARNRDIADKMVRHLVTDKGAFTLISQVSLTKEALNYVGYAYEVK